jgi:hypothetical protein
LRIPASARVVAACRLACAARPQGIGPALRGGAGRLLRAGLGDGRGHDRGGFPLMVTGTGPDW